MDEYDQEDDFDQDNVFPPAVQVEAEFSTDGGFQLASNLPTIEAEDDSVIEHGQEEENPFVIDSSLLLPESTANSLVMLDDGSIDLRDPGFAVDGSLAMDKDLDEEKDQVIKEEAQAWDQGNAEDNVSRGVSIEIPGDKLDLLQTTTPRVPPQQDLIEEEEADEFDEMFDESVNQRSLAMEIHETLSFDESILNLAPAAEGDADDEADVL